MNRILPIQGAATTRGDAPMVEANRSQQQRFEQAMQQEQDLKERTNNPRPEGKAQSRQSPRPTDVQPLPQLHAHRPPSEEGKQLPPRRSAKGMWPDHKEITAKQLRQGSEQTDPKQVASPPFDRQQSQSLTDNPERVTVLDISAKERRDEPDFAAHSDTERVDANPIAVTADTPFVPPTVASINAITPAFEQAHLTLTIATHPTEPGLTAIAQPHDHVAQVTPTENEWLNEQHPVIEAHKAANANAIDVITNTAPHQLPLATDNEAITPKLASSLRTDIGELAAQLDAEIQQLTAIKPVTTGETAPKGELLANPAIWVAPLAVTPGDLQLARLAPADSHRELGQLLERLAVDIYQELGRPERPPLLRLTLPQLGDLAIRIAHQGGELQIEILATEQGELQLNQGRSDLVDRLQRLYPGERVALDLFGQPDSEQGSRHKRSIYEEWDADA